MSAARQQMIDFLQRYKSDKEEPFSIAVAKDKREYFVRRIFDAIKKRHKIYIFGDYDVDGIGSTTMMVEMIRDVSDFCGYGEVDIEFEIPSRADHYGMSKDLFEQKKADKDLIIILDNGTHKDFFQSLLEEDKKNLLIVDHHPNGDFSRELCVINPNSDGSVKICTGILIEILFQTFRIGIPEYGKFRPENHFHDLVGLTLISDVASLNNGLVRAYIQSGINRLSDRERLLYKELIPKFKGKINMVHAAFELVPTINSVGRMSDSPSWGVEMLLAKSKNAKNLSLVYKAVETNAQRKEVTDYFTKKIVAALQLSNDKRDKLIFAHDDDIPIGINGIIAANVFAYFGVDTIITSKNLKSGGTIVGSGRGSNISYQLTKILADSSEDVFKFGGHRQAVGVRIENVDEMTKAVERYNEAPPEPGIDFRKEKLLIIEEPQSITQYKEMAEAYHDLILSDIKFSDDFFVKIEGRIIGFKEYRNGFAKLTLRDNDLKEISFLTKTDKKVNYHTVSPQVFVVSVSPLRLSASSKQTVSASISVAANQNKDEQILFCPKT